MDWEIYFFLEKWKLIVEKEVSILNQINGINMKLIMCDCINI